LRKKKQKKELKQVFLFSSSSFSLAFFCEKSKTNSEDASLFSLST